MTLKACSNWLLKPRNPSPFTSKQLALEHIVSAEGIY